jgi:hypothetical protein
VPVFVVSLVLAVFFCIDARNTQLPYSVSQYVVLLANYGRVPFIKFFGPTMPMQVPPSSSRRFRLERGPIGAKGQLSRDARDGEMTRSQCCCPVTHACRIIAAAVRDGWTIPILARPTRESPLSTPALPVPECTVASSTRGSAMGDILIGPANGKGGGIQWSKVDGTPPSWMLTPEMQTRLHVCRRLLLFEMAMSETLGNTVPKCAHRTSLVVGKAQLCTRGTMLQRYCHSVHTERASRTR